MLDLAIIGGGPAGLTAGLYSTRGGLKSVVMFEKGMPGGQITQSSEVENYPGISKVVTGLELMENWPEQCKRFGLKVEMDEVVKISQNSDKSYKLTLANSKEVDAMSVIIATGSTSRRAGFENENEFLGRGVSTCATCDGFFYKNREIAVLGGGDTALEEALFLSNICSKIYLIHRRDSFRASPSTIERVKKNSKIEFILDTQVLKAYGDKSGLTGLELKNLKTQEVKNLEVPGIFTFVGYDVNNSILKDEDGNSICALSESGEIIVDLNMNTSLEGLFAAGDIRVNAPKQVVCAASDGAIAAIETISYVEKFKGE